MGRSSSHPPPTHTTAGSSGSINTESQVLGFNPPPDKEFTLCVIVSLFFSAALCRGSGLNHLCHCYPCVLAACCQVTFSLTLASVTVVCTHMSLDQAQQHGKSLLNPDVVIRQRPGAVVPGRGRGGGGEGGRKQRRRRDNEDQSNTLHHICRSTTTNTIIIPLKTQSQTHALVCQRFTGMDFMFTSRLLQQTMFTQL